VRKTGGGARASARAPAATPRGAKRAKPRRRSARVRAAAIASASSGGPPPVLAISGPSRSGKTRLLVRLIPALVERGLRIAALKHSSHDHPLDRRGKDTARLRAAGAEAVAIQTPGAMALFRTPFDEVDELVALLPDVDLVLAEGWKASRLPKLEVHRRAVSREFLCATDVAVVAVATDEPLPTDGLPRWRGGLPAFDADDVDAIAHFIVGWFAEVAGAPRTTGRRAPSTAKGAKVSRRTPAPRGARRRPAPASR
jgi:molybdopterin-guanine dinucleotide biosynthesis protein MobB